MYASLLQETENAFADWLRISPWRKMRWSVNSLVPADTSQPVTAHSTVLACHEDWSLLTDGAAFQQLENNIQAGTSHKSA